VKKYLYKILYPLARIYWGIFQPATFGVRLLLINDGKVLLVSHTYIPGGRWMMPGGGLGRGDTYESAIKRELKEELNIDMANIELAGVYMNQTEGKRDNVILFRSEDAVNEVNIKIDPAEIIEYKFHDLDNLPDDIADGHRRRIEEYKAGKLPGFGEW